MIRTRSPQYENAPPPPKWIDPEQLGATELRRIQREHVCVIDGGRQGLLKFLQRIRSRSLPAWDAFVVVRRDMGGVYVFSKEQFWLAASMFMQRASPPSGASGQENDSPRTIWRRFLQKKDSLFRQATELAPDDSSLENVVSEVFDIHEYAVSEETGPGQMPTRPGVEYNPGSMIAAVHVPDTRDFGEHVASLPRASSPPAGRGTSMSERSGLESLEPADDRSLESVRPTTEELLHRTPHMDLSREGALHSGEELRIVVFVDDSAARLGEESDSIVISAPSDVRKFEVNVWLVATPHFAIVQPATKTLTIDRDESRSTAAAFDVMVRGGVQDSSRPKITAVFQHKGRACGRVSRHIEFELPTAAVAETEAPRELMPKIEIRASAPEPDITVIITNPNRDGRTYECLVSTPLLEDYRAGRAEPWQLSNTTETIVAQHFKLFTTAGYSGEQRIANLRGAGRELFKIAPKAFRDAFWRIIDAGKPLRAISIVSEEAFIPWELMIPERRRPDGTLEQRQPLGVEFLVGRWIRDDYCLSRHTVPLRDSWIFAPSYHGPRPKPLASAPAEAELVRSRFSGTMISPAVFNAFENAMRSGGRSLLHFVCHGSSPGAGAQAIFCEDNTEFSSTALGGAAAAPKACAVSKPFVFINACEVGRTTPALIGVGGFAAAFIELGASCVIAPLWSVKDDIAHKVAEDFYNATLARPDRPFAEILAGIRARAYAPNEAEDTYAAYCFYGDPLAAQK